MDSKSSPSVSSVVRVISHRIPIPGWKSSSRSPGIAGEPNRTAARTRGPGARLLAPANPGDTARAMSQENVEVVRRLIHAANERDPDAFVAHLHPDVEWVETGDVLPGLR